MPTVEQARAWYPADDPVHGFGHIRRVAAIAEQLADELEADREIVRAAALLHDAQKADPNDGKRKDHHRKSAEFAREALQAEGWPSDRIEQVQHCIRAHRYRGDEAPVTLEAQIVFDADKLDVIGAFGAARTVGYALQAGQPIYAEPSERFLTTGERERGEPHSAYHEYVYKLQHVYERLYTEPARRMGEQRLAVLTAFFEQLAAEASWDR